jgi:hypothetical protein
LLTFAPSVGDAVDTVVGKKVLAKYNIPHLEVSFLSDQLMAGRLSYKGRFGRTGNDVTQSPVLLPQIRT